MNDPSPGSTSSHRLGTVALVCSVVFLAVLAPITGAAAGPRVTHSPADAGTATALVPTADAGENASIPPGVDYELDGTGSRASGEGSLTYAWVQVAGPAVTILGENTATPAFSSPEIDSERRLVFKLIVTGEDGRRDSDTVTVTVSPDEAPPIAYAGADRVVANGSRVVLDASESFDPNGDELTYSWSQLGVPFVGLTDTGTATAEFVAPEVDSPQTFSFRLRVSDGKGGTDSDRVSITVSPDPQQPAADAGPDLVVDERAEVTVDGTGSSDPNGDDLTYSWSQTLGPITFLDGRDTPTPSFTAPYVTSPKTVVLELTVTDSDGNAATDEVEIRVTPVDNAPVADAGANATVGSGADVTLDGSGSTNPDGGGLEFSWAQADGPSVTLEGGDTPTPSFSAPDVASPRTLEFVLTVEDGDGAIATDRVAVTVEPSSGGDGDGDEFLSRSFASTTVAPGGTVSVDLSMTFEESQDRLVVRDGYSGPVESVEVGSVTFDGEPASDAVVLSRTDEGSLEVVLEDVPAGTAELGYELTVAGSAGDGDQVSFTGVEGADVEGDVSGEFGTGSVAVSASGGSNDGAVNRSLGSTTVRPGGELEVTMTVETDGPQGRLSLRDDVEGPVGAIEFGTPTVDGDPVDTLFTGQLDGSGVVVLQGVPADATLSVTYTVEVNESAAAGDRIRFVGHGSGPDVLGESMSADFGTDVAEVGDPAGFLATIDADGDGRIDDGELQAAIELWVGGDIADGQLQAAITAWVEGSY
jgi:hypothetical protein